MRLAAEMGVPIASGGNTGMALQPHRGNVRELELLSRRGGLDAEQTLAAATTTAAAAFGRAGELGRIGVNYVGDLIAVSADSLDDQATLYNQSECNSSSKQEHRSADRETLIVDSTSAAPVESGERLVEATIHPLPSRGMNLLRESADENLYKFRYDQAMAQDVIPTSEVRAALGKITKRFDDGDTEPVFFGSHRRTQAVLVPIATWEKLLERAEDELDLDLARRRLTDQRPWLGEDELNAALRRAAEEASRQKPA